MKPSAEQIQAVSNRIRRMIADAKYKAPEVRDQFMADEIASLCRNIWDMAIADKAKGEQCLSN